MNAIQIAVLAGLVVGGSFFAIVRIMAKYGPAKGYNFETSFISRGALVSVGLAVLVALATFLALRR